MVEPNKNTGILQYRQRSFRHKILKRKFSIEKQTE